MFSGEWVWLVLASVGLIAVLTGLEFLSAAITGIGEAGAIVNPGVESKRAA